MTITLIACASHVDGIIGSKNELPWQGQQRNDMQHFKGLTWDRTVVMGRKTFESLGSKPLKSRTCLVVTSTPFDTIQLGDNGGSARAVTIEHVLDWYKDSEEEIFVIGGGQLYEVMLPFANRVLMTWLSDAHDVIVGDTQFPTLDPKVWTEVATEHHSQDHKNKYAYQYATYVKA